MTLRGFIVWLGARELLFKKSSSLYLCHHSHFSSADLLCLLLFSTSRHWHLRVLVADLQTLQHLSEFPDNPWPCQEHMPPPTPCSTIMYIFIFIFSLPPNLGKPLVLTKESLFIYFLLQLKNFSENCKLPLSLSISLNGC